MTTQFGLTHSDPLISSCLASGSQSWQASEMDKEVERTGK